MFKISVTAVVHAENFTPKIVDVKDLREHVQKESPNFDEIISIPFGISWKIISENLDYYRNKTTGSLNMSSGSTEVVSDVSLKH